VSSLAERLREVVGGVHVGRTQSGPPGEPDKARPTKPVGDAAADVLGGEWRELRGERFLVIDRKYPPGHRHGHVAVADTLPPDEGCWSRFPLLDGSAVCIPTDGRMLFLDLETTGIAGGAGTYAFLVGLAWYQDGCLRVRQFFLSNFAAERVLLEAVADVADQCGAVVTYNGKSFDLPLIDTRYQLHRLETPFTGMPHVDMLHPARCLWRRDDTPSGEPALVRRSDRRNTVEAFRQTGREGGCRLTALEHTLCGHVREGDVPGFEIPSRYFHFVRTGDPRGLAAVMEHNRLDLVSLAMLTARASQLLEDGPATARTGREALGMGRLYERAGMTVAARAAFLRAAEYREADTVMAGPPRLVPGLGGTGPTASVCAEAWRAYAVLSRRERRFADAAHGWRRILELGQCPPAIQREASEALAVHHEHRLRDLQAARAFALQSLTVNSTRSRHEATQHRLARLERKLSGSHNGHEEPQRELFSL
jgi:uncharacterized protein YprB with RNaseH-like and TPR domain